MLRNYRFGYTTTETFQTDQKIKQSEIEQTMEDLIRKLEIITSQNDEKQSKCPKVFYIGILAF